MSVKLSELADDTLVMRDGEMPMTAQDLRSEIEDGVKHHGQFYLAVWSKWEPSAEHMINHFLEWFEDDNYEGWFDIAKEALMTVQPQMQALLDESVSQDSRVTDLYAPGDKVQIDWR